MVVGLWGAILLMGVTDPLGGINTLFPLFGIANQLLAAIALTVVTVIVVKKGHLKWAWIPGGPAGVGPGRDDDGVVPEDLLRRAAPSGTGRSTTRSGGAKAAGETSFGTAKTPEAIDAVIRNTFIQGTLSIVFAVLVLIVAVVGAVVCIKAIRSGTATTMEVEPVPSRIFGPRGLISSPAEREVQHEWDRLVAEGKVDVPGAAHRGGH